MSCLREHPRKPWVALALFALVAVFAPAAVGHDAPAVSRAKASREEPSLWLELSVSRDSLSPRDSTPLRLKVAYGAAAGARTRERPPLNVAIVLDRSGSMAEDQKLRFALAAARVVVENLSSRDYVSIVAYNDAAVVVSPAGAAVNRTFLDHRLDEVTAAGWTDLSAGLLEGIAQVSRVSAPGQSRHVLLLTDGLANRGVIEQSGLLKIVAAARAQRIELSTFGCGTQFDGKLLRAMAEAGSGRYHYARSAEQIPLAFKEELNGLLAVVAQNARLEIDVTAPSTIERVYAAGIEEPRAVAHQTSLGSLRVGERGVLVAEVTTKKQEPAADHVDLHVRLTFDDVATGRRVSREARQRLALAERTEPERRGVVLYGEVRAALQRAMAAAEGLDRERASTARAEFSRVYESARAYAFETRDQDLLNETFMLKHFLDELAVAESLGWTHSHEEAQRAIGNEADYERYLLLHHRGQR
jgi:Mg-chelatase subunit ChlD